jgi:multidrug resistance efflux pump
MERAERLYNDGVIPKQQYEIAGTNYKNSQKSLEEWEANLNLLLNSPTKEEIQEAAAALQEGKTLLKGAEENLKITEQACKSI